MSRARLARAAPALVLALALAHGEIWRAGAAQVAPLGPDGSIDLLPEVSIADVTFEAWLVARNARTLLTRPWRLFDTEHCAPEQRSITFGVPMYGLGALAMPAALWTREPVLIYNAALLAWSATAALGMYLLVARWTTRRAAGVAAALLFAFHPIRLQHILHPSEWDITWTLFALYFAERLFAGGRWRDAVGLALAGSMQVATSFYTLCAATLLALPLGAWLCLRRPLRVRPAQLALAVGCVALTAALLLAPYYAAREASRIGERTHFFFARWQDYAPGGLLFLGWPLGLLALAGVAAPRARALAGLASEPRRRGDPRPALLAGALLVAFVGAGPSNGELLSRLGLPLAGFDPYALLARAVPGRDAVRAVARLSTGVHAVACVLAGAGVAALMQLAGRRAQAVGALAVCAALLASFGAPLPRPAHWILETIRPSQEEIDFFAGLPASASGPIFELPVDYHAEWERDGPARILLSAWHGRRTSACFGSYLPARRAELDRLGNLLPHHRAVVALHEQGFTTLVLHHRGWHLGDPVATYTRRRHRHVWLELLRRDAARSAYALHVEPAR